LTYRFPLERYNSALNCFPGSIEHKRKRPETSGTFSSCGRWRPKMVRLGHQCGSLAVLLASAGAILTGQIAHLVTIKGPSNRLFGSVTSK
jgi:hypothetical protein